MWATNFKVVAIAALVIGFYTTIAHIIPQLQSEVPEAVDLSGGATPEALVAAGEKLFNGAGQCTSCHGLGTRAPNLLTDHAGEGTIGVRCATREADKGKDCKAYLYESLTEPAAYVVKGFDVLMPDMRRLFSSEQIWALVAFLQSQGGAVTVTAEDIARTGGSAAGVTAGGAAPAPGAAAAGAAPAAPPKPAAPAAPLDARQKALVAAGESVFNGIGTCTTCHGTGLLAPNLLTDHSGEGPIGARCGGREKGKDCNAYLYESISDPKAYVVNGFDPIMPATLKAKMSEEQIWQVIAFLEAQGGKVTVSAADMAKAAAKGPAPSPAAPAPGAAPANASAPGGTPPGSAPAPAASPAPPAAPAAPPPPAIAAFAAAGPTAPGAILPPDLMTPENLVLAGQAVFNGRGGCTACHGNPMMAPNLLTDHNGQGPIGARCATRKPGMDCNAYIFESLTKPDAFVVDGFENIMSNFSFRLSKDQIWALIAFLESNGGKPAVTPADIQSTRTAAPAGAAAPGGAATPAPAPPAAAPAAPAEAAPR